MSSGAPKRSSSCLSHPPRPLIAPNLSPALHFAAGLCTGVLSASLLQPADLLKTRVQQSPSSTLLGTLRSITAGPHALRELWRGTLPSIIRTGFGSALYFTTLNALRRSSAFAPSPSSSPTTPTSHLPHNSNTANLASGAIARVFAGMVLMPVTVLKVRYESSLYVYTSLPGAFASILRAEGPRAFFAGFGATAVRDAPYAGLYVLFYEQAKRRLRALQGNARRRREQTADGNGASDGAGSASVLHSAPINFLSGVLAAGLATALTNPFDAVKTRLQLRPREYGNMVRAVRRMVGEEGVRSLFDGLGLRVARKAMSSAIVWSLYEELIRIGERRLEASGGGERLF